ncbi:glycerophosphodiester phosphodiesterase [Nonomuraea sp. NPDC050556]|uniref:glycerophosphodiester phosphodiesterase n=1 Tax=Nonomuraea sp. NPDC050556 TaxID=3364369 RepID=UPI0037BCB4CF
MKLLRRALLGLVAVLLAAFLVNLAMYYVFVPARPVATFPGAATPLFIAHQGGEELAPSNTMVAFENAVALGADVLETDIHQTRDGELVAIHDDTVDRTTDGKGRVDSFAYADLARLDAGYSFRDLQGRLSFRGKGAKVPRLEELFVKFPDKLFNVEIKAAYPGIEEKLWGLIRRYRLEDKVVVVSFDQGIVDRFREVSGGRVALGAGKSEATLFALTHKFRVPGFYRPRASVLQLPTESNGFDLADERLIEGAHRLGMQVHYWTVNDEATMRELIALGADGIMTDRPDLLKKVLQ